MVKNLANILPYAYIVPMTSSVLELYAESSPPPAPLGIVDQVRAAGARRNRWSMACGAILGGFVPVASYVVAHYEAPERPALIALVVGGLAYSALSVYGFARLAFGSAVKALGFVLLLEGVMVFSGIPALGLASLVLLVGINAISTGVRLALDARQTRACGRRRSRGVVQRRRPLAARRSVGVTPGASSIGAGLVQRSLPIV